MKTGSRESLKTTKIQLTGSTNSKGLLTNLILQLYPTQREENSKISQDSVEMLLIGEISYLRSSTSSNSKIQKIRKTLRLISRVFRQLVDKDNFPEDLFLLNKETKWEKSREMLALVSSEQMSRDCSSMKTKALPYLQRIPMWIYPKNSSTMGLSKKSAGKIRLSGKHLVRIMCGYKSYKSEDKLLMDQIVP